MGDDGKSCHAALEAADRAMGRVAEITARRNAHGFPVTRFYIGLHLGDVLYGNIVGPSSRLDFTVIGPWLMRSVGSRPGRVLPHDLIVSSAFAEVAKGSSDRLVSLGRYAPRGVRSPQWLSRLNRANTAKAA